MTPDELKAIAERAKIRRAIFSWDSLAATLKQTEADRKALLSHIQDIRRDTARDCAIIALNGCLVLPDGGSPTEAEREMCEAIAASIRTAYGVEG